MDQYKEILCTICKPLVQWERLRHPYAGWARAGLLLLLPVVIWSHSLLLIALYVAAAVAHAYWFPPYVSASANEPFMTRLTDVFQDWFENTNAIEKLPILFPAAILTIPLLASLWAHSLFWSFYFFTALVFYKVIIGYRMLEEDTALTAAIDIDYNDDTDDEDEDEDEDEDDTHHA